MRSWESIRSDFPMLKASMAHHPLIYFDNGATTLKPQVVIDRVVQYYASENVNVHRGDYELSGVVSARFDRVRETVATFINASAEEIIFTSGTTEGCNIVALGLESTLTAQDRVVTVLSEHSSNILPVFHLVQQVGCELAYLETDENGRILVEKIEEAITTNTKFVAINHVSNVLGYVNPIKAIVQRAHQVGALVLVDGAQAAPHFELNVQELDCDFYAFSAHKMCGPNGVGVLYGKYQQLEKLSPVLMGGGANSRFYKDGSVTFSKIPDRFEPGTRNIEGVLGFGEAIKYLSALGMDRIHQREIELKTYLYDQMKAMDNIEIINPDPDVAIISFNVEGIFAQDVASYLSHFGIAVRSGTHCAKLLPEIVGATQSVRASLYFYNTIEEIDQFINILSNISLEKTIELYI